MVVVWHGDQWYFNTLLDESLSQLLTCAGIADDAHVPGLVSQAFEAGVFGRDNEAVDADRRKRVGSIQREFVIPAIHKRTKKCVHPVWERSAGAPIHLRDLTPSRAARRATIVLS
jgi:hypothetical protein